MNKSKSPPSPNESQSRRSIPVINLNTRETTRITSEMFMPPLNAAARRVVGRGGGIFQGQIGKCRVKILHCGGSALITVRQCASEPVGMAIVSWSLVCAEFAWGELARAQAETLQEMGNGIVNVNCPKFGRLPQAGTFIWPNFMRRGGEQVFLAETMLWALITALTEERQQTMNADFRRGHFPPFGIRAPKDIKLSSCKSDR